VVIFSEKVWIFVLCPGANTWWFKNIKLTDSFWKVFRFMSWRRLFVVYLGNERGIFYFGWTNENRKYIFFPTRCRRSVASCVNETKINLLFNDLARRFGISKGLASRMYNSWMPVLAEKLQGLVVWLPRYVYLVKSLNTQVYIFIYAQTRTTIDGLFITMTGYSICVHKIYLKYLCKKYLTNCNFVLIILKLLTINKKAITTSGGTWNNYWFYINEHTISI
jgi:hypothetical protein